MKGRRRRECGTCRRRTISWFRDPIAVPENNTIPSPHRFIVVVRMCGEWGEVEERRAKTLHLQNIVCADNLKTKQQKTTIH